MDVDVSEPLAHQLVTFDEVEGLLISGHGTGRQHREQVEDFAPLCQLTASELTDHKRMDQDLAAVECLHEGWIRLVEVVDPDGRVDEDHEGRRLRGAFASRSLPPSRASLLALSRAINARRPSWISAVRSCVPVNRWASEINCSSRLMVVRISPSVDASMIHHMMPESL